MCGACGRTVTADEVLGPARTVRQHLIVASTVNGLCDGLPGVPGVKVAGDAWLLSGATGTAVECRTVLDLWEAIAAALSRVGGVDGPATGPAGQLTERLTSARSSAEGLRRDVIDAGLHQLGRSTGAGQAPGSS